MSDSVLITIIGAITTTITVSINAAVVLRSRKQSQEEHLETRAAVLDVTAKVEATHNEINGRMTELLVAAKAQGAQDQRAEIRRDAKDAQDK
jgi:hypothetical protein